MNKSCLIIAGEQSGEDHAMTFIEDVKKRCPNVSFFGVGGEKLKSQGVELLYHLNDFSSMGITEVVAKLPFYYKAMSVINSEVKRRECKTAILIDFQGFNLKLAQKLKKRGVNVLYYVAPQAWAWKSYRAKVVEKCVHTLFTILPFEKKWFKDRGVSRIKAVKHPLAIEYSDRLNTLRSKNSKVMQDRKPRLLILPGSRNSEVELMLPVFLDAISIIKEGVDIECAIVKTRSVNERNYKFIDSSIKTFFAEDLFEASDWADLCIATSGTVTLATGLFSLPTVVAYKLSAMNEFILKLIVKYKGAVSLTNIIHGKILFPEYLHYQADKYNLSKEVINWLKNPTAYDNTIEELNKTRDLLSGDNFNLSEYMAEVINNG